MVSALNFLKCFGKRWVRFVNYGFSKGKLSITQREGIITCIPKENKPRQFVKIIDRFRYSIVYIKLLQESSHTE